MQFMTTVYFHVGSGLIGMGYSISEQQRFKSLESLSCPVHRRHAKIDFPIGGGIRVSKCCCNGFEQRILMKIYALIPRIIEARK